MKALIFFGLSVWVALHFFVGTSILGLQLQVRLESEDEVGGCEDPDLERPFRALWRVSVAYASLASSAISFALYLYVSYRAPRPWEFHGYGVLLFVMLPGFLMQELQTYMLCEGFYRPRLAVQMLAFGFITLRTNLLVELILRKVRVLGPRSEWHSCRHPTPWVRSLQVVRTLSFFLGNIPFYTWGMVDIEGWKTRRNGGGDEALSGFGKVLHRAQGMLVPLGFVLIVFLMVAFLITTWLSIRSVLRKLGDRSAAPENVATLRRVLRRHLWGAIAAIATKVMVMLSAIIATQLPRRLDQPWNLQLWGNFIDCIGDLAGIFLLSGLGALLVREDPDMADNARLFRSLVHSAVMTSRGENVFEGKVMMTGSRRCVASFPGKYIAEWHSLTWLCEQGDLSSACVFLPQADPQRRFGRHSPNPDDGNRCWCHTIYGAVKPWGCMWFEAWKANVEEAVRLRLDLVAVYFSGEAGRGEVAWADLASANLWDGVGLGGSQKAEVAFLEKSGIPFIREDLDAFRLSMLPR